MEKEKEKEKMEGMEGEEKKGSVQEEMLTYNSVKIDFIKCVLGRRVT